MTPLQCATTLDKWAANAKTDESRAVCEMAAIGMRNAAKTREIADQTNGQVVMHYMRDEQGDQFIVAAGHHVVGARSLSDALDGLLEKVAKRAATT